MIEILCVLSLFISLLVLFIFIVFIKNTREKILKLSEELQNYNVQIEQSLNSLVRDVNTNNNLLHSHNTDNIVLDSNIINGSNGMNGMNGSNGINGSNGMNGSS